MHQVCSHTHARLPTWHIYAIALVLRTYGTHGAFFLSGSHGARIPYVSECLGCQSWRRATMPEGARESSRSFCSCSCESVSDGWPCSQKNIVCLLAIYLARWVDFLSSSWIQAFSEDLPQGGIEIPCIY